MAPYAQVHLFGSRKGCCCLRGKPAGLTGNKIEELVRIRYATLEKKGSRRLIDIPQTVIGSKLSHPEWSLSDAVLWVFKCYAQVEAPTGSRGHRRPGETSEHKIRKHQG